MCENETFKCKYTHVRVIVHNSALLLHTTYQTPTPCCYLGEWSHHAFENRPEEEKSTVSIHASVVVIYAQVGIN